MTVTNSVFNQEQGHEAEAPAHLRTVVDVIVMKPNEFGTRLP